MALLHDRGPHGRQAEQVDESEDRPVEEPDRGADEEQDDDARNPGIAAAGAATGLLRSRGGAVISDQSDEDDLLG